LIDQKVEANLNQEVSAMKYRKPKKNSSQNSRLLQKAALWLI
jgi:hypothetical protein